MAQECTHDCSTCGKNCSDRTEAFDFSAKLNAASSVTRVIAVASGKGGVGKSFVTTMLAVAAMREGLRVGILDADITGPSIPQAFGLVGGTYQSDKGIEPTMSTGGIRVMSLNMLIDNPSDPVVWRGPVIAGAVKQFWTDVHWGELDILFVDMPPGTGDVPLTVFQSLPVDGVVVVSSPQDLVEMIVSKSVKMAGMMNKPVLGLVENMSYLSCPDCGKQIAVFGPSKAETLAARFSIPANVRLPIDPSFAAAIDAGAAETVEIPAFQEFARKIFG
jgi:Mrp family chromosome partitioning ATPase